MARPLLDAAAVMPTRPHRRRRARAHPSLDRSAAAAALACIAALAAPSSAIAQERARVVDPEVPPGAAQAPTPREPSAADAAPAPAPGVAVWTQPLWTIVTPLIVPDYSRYYPFNVGVSVSLSRGLDLVIEVDVTHRPPPSWGGGSRTSGSVSVGLAVFLTGARPMNGLFVQPKVTLLGGTLPEQTAPLYAFGAALDVGYQFTAGHFFVAPVFGFGGAVSVGNGQPAYVVLRNNALVRVGVAF